MSISLFPHNQSAYDSLLELLQTEQRACVIHPTGTGKSFIGFKYCEDYPEQSVLWLSPSEYIFKTQREGLRATGAEVPGNISFMTYAKLSITETEELSDLHPDVVILDEMHRAAAPTWEKPVQMLINRDPKPTVIGLTATHIRYLDGQKDTTETFDMNIASEMTLGEAIVRGLLKSPRYVLSVFAYQEDYERMRSRVHRTKNKAVRHEAEQYLEALRRALEKADGLDVIFDKHMTDRAGKYIVFCANLEHMREMQSKAMEFFRKIDSAPHIYTAYSSDSTTDKAFAAFKADRSEHLKLLYCIDMLNEGIHVDDVSGVVLFRPTVSPIVYKQQIGRALSVSGSGTPVIFDIVNNIDNLYAIDTIQQEVREAIRYWHGEGQEFADAFKVFDEVRDARELFERLNDTLSASWDTMYEYARQYHEENGNLEIPYRYKTPEGYSLGNWIATQRKVYAGLQYGSLSEERIAKLEAIGMIWGSYRALSWDRYYEEAKSYFEKHVDLLVPATYITENGVRLGAWVANQRTAKRNGSGISEEHIEKLDAIGMVWSVNDQLWEQGFAACKIYYQEHGDLNIPAAYRTPDGVQLGTWIARQRDIRRGKAKGSPLTDEQIARLDSLGMAWEGKFEKAWDRGLAEAKAYFAEHGDLDVPATYVSSSGYRLGKWISTCREKGRGKHSEQRLKQLDEIGMVWKKQDSWEVRYALAADYSKTYGNLNIPGDYKADGIWLGKWINEQRQIRIGNRPSKTLSSEQIARLDALGMVWDNRKHIQWSRAWEDQYQEAKAFYDQNGHLSIPHSYLSSDGKKLGVWIFNQRKRKRQGKLPAEQVKMLEEIGMIWEFDDSWETGYQHAEAYFTKHENLDVPPDYTCEDGYKLGQWIRNQRSCYTSTDRYRALSSDQKNRLESISMIWKPSELQWQNGYAHAAEYMKTLNGQAWKVLYVSPDGFKTGQWIRGQIRRYQRGTMEPKRQQLLEEIGLIDVGSIPIVSSRNQAISQSIPANV